MIKVSFGPVTTKLKQLGFKAAPPTKSKKYSLVYSSATAKGYISIRYDSAKNVSAVIAEFYGQTKSKGEGIGGSMYLVRIVPNMDNVIYYRGYNEKRCQAEFVKIAKYMMRAAIVFAALGKF